MTRWYGLRCLPLGVCGQEGEEAGGDASNAVNGAPFAVLATAPTACPPRLRLRRAVGCSPGTVCCISCGTSGITISSTTAVPAAALPTAPATRHQRHHWWHYQLHRTSGYASRNTISIAISGTVFCIVPRLPQHHQLRRQTAMAAAPLTASSPSVTSPAALSAASSVTPSSASSVALPAVPLATPSAAHMPSVALSTYISGYVIHCATAAPSTMPLATSSTTPVVLPSAAPSPRHQRHCLLH